MPVAVAQSGYPLMPVSEMPSIKLRWAKKNRMTAYSVERNLRKGRPVLSQPGDLDSAFNDSITHLCASLLRTSNRSRWGTGPSAYVADFSTG